MLLQGARTQLNSLCVTAVVSTSHTPCTASPLTLREVHQAGLGWVCLKPPEGHCLGSYPHGDRECSQSGIVVTLTIVLMHSTVISPVDSGTAS